MVENEKNKVILCQGRNLIRSHHSKKDLPEDRESIERIAREIFGVPRSSCQPPDEYQIEGIGKGKSTSNKLFIIDVNIEDKMVCSTFIQLENISSRVSWDVNCGNMTTAIPLVLDDLGLMDVIKHNEKITIHNTNTNKMIYCSLPKKAEKISYVKYPEFIIVTRRLIFPLKIRKQARQTLFSRQEKN